MNKFSKRLGSLSIALGLIQLVLTIMELRSTLMMRKLIMIESGITPGIFESAPQNAIMMRSSILGILFFLFGCLAVFSKKQGKIATKVLLGLYGLSVIAAASAYLILRFA